jgi:hypothetical protein
VLVLFWTRASSTRLRGCVGRSGREQLIEFAAAVSPIQICGTVDRPAFDAISDRREASPVTSISSNVVPLVRRSSFAKWQ